jgi:glycosyltransferase involved in cell wall biosynthesis
MRVVWTEHDELPRAFIRMRPVLRLYRRIARGANRILCVSGFVREDLVTQGLPADQLVVCHNGIDAGVQRDRASRRASRSAFELPADAVVVGTVSRLAWTKGLTHLMDAAPSIIARAPDTYFLIVGDGPERADLEARVAHHGLIERFRFAGHRTDIPDLLDAIDIFASPSLNEGLPFGTLEAMAAGLPVVASRVGGLAEVVEDGVTGRLVPARDPVALAAATAELVLDPPLRERFGRAGRARVVDAFGIDRMLDRTEAVLTDAGFAGATATGATDTDHGLAAAAVMSGTARGPATPAVG